MSENSIKSIMDVTMDKLRAMVDANTIIGDPIVVGDVTLLPVSKVSFGLATGGSDFPSKTQSGLFGGGGGAGVTIAPVMKRIVALVIICIIFSLPVSAVSTSAKAAAVINGDTGEVLYSQNADTRLPMASTTKIMTSLLLCEHGNLEKEITVTADMLKVEGSSMGLLPGDTVTLHDLLYGMLLASGNDAANVTAIAA